MYGIDLNSPIEYLYSSMRYFAPNEKHVNRLCQDEVLLLVYQGVLRFCEDGKEYEVKRGEYHIQKAGSIQAGNFPSDTPKYLYVHFKAKRSDGENCLAPRGEFEVNEFFPLMEELDRLNHNKAPLAQKLSVFFSILSGLFKKSSDNSVADSISDYISSNLHCNITLSDLCHRFHFSKNHIITLFKNKYKMTPIQYINHKKLEECEYHLEVTSQTTEDIAFRCGFNNYSHFYRLFIKKHGISPAQWRNNLRSRG
jgi:AraC-like DNA-binding protein